MSAQPPSTAGFSLVAGGPAHGLQQRLGLVDPASFHPVRRALVSILLTWVALLVLSAVQGLAIGGGVKIPFLYDYAAYARFLIAIPMLIVAEGFIGPRIARVAAHFGRSGLVSESDRPAYEAALDRGRRMRDSVAGGSRSFRSGVRERHRRPRRVPAGLLDVAIARVGLRPHPHAGRLVVPGRRRGAVRVSPVAVALAALHLVRLSLAHVEARSPADRDAPRPRGGARDSWATPSASSGSSSRPFRSRPPESSATRSSMGESRWRASGSRWRATSCWCSSSFFCR